MILRGDQLLAGMWMKRSFRGSTPVYRPGRTMHYSPFTGEYLEAEEDWLGVEAIGALSPICRCNQCRYKVVLK